MNKSFFYIGLGLQLFGLTSVTLCLFAGLRNGDYGKIELAQLILGAFFFYVGNYLKNYSGSSR